MQKQVNALIAAISQTQDEAISKLLPEVAKYWYEQLQAHIDRLRLHLNNGDECEVNGEALMALSTIKWVKEL